MKQDFIWKKKSYIIRRSTFFSFSLYLFASFSVSLYPYLCLSVSVSLSLSLSPPRSREVIYLCLSWDKFIGTEIRNLELECFKFFFSRFKFFSFASWKMLPIFRRLLEIQSMKLNLVSSEFELVNEGLLSVVFWHSVVFLDN